MKQVLPLLIIMSIIIACQPKTEKKTETYADGTPKVEQFFKKDSLVKEVTYYKNQQKRYEGEYMNGSRHGKWTYWYPNGNVWSEGFFFKGENDSTRIVYHENGNKYYSGKYRKGQRVGVWKFWDEDGKYIKQVDYTSN